MPSSWPCSTSSVRHDKINVKNFLCVPVSHCHLQVIFCSQTSVWRAVDAAKTIAVLRPPDAGESIALKILENPSLVAILQRPTI